MDNQKRTLYDFEWQVLRINLDFSTNTDAKISIKKVLDYVDKYKTPEAYYKAINLFAVTAMGFNDQMVQLETKQPLGWSGKVERLSQWILNVQAARIPLSLTYKQQKLADKTSWEVNNEVRKVDIQMALTLDLLKVYHDLNRRWTAAHLQNYKVQRDELSEYLQMLGAELLIRGELKKPMLEGVYIDPDFV